VQFQQLCAQLRRYGHISENAPGNVGAALHGPPRQARLGAYLASGDARALQDAVRRTAETGGAGTYFGQPQSDVQGSFWDSLLPHDPTENPFAAWADTGQQEYPGGSRSTEAWNDG
jgi:hypothetical protein